MPNFLRPVTVALVALCLTTSGLYAQSRAKNHSQNNTKQVQSTRGIRDSSKSAIPLENSFKVKPKKQSKVIITPAKALQGSEPQIPEKPVPKK